MNFAYLDKAFKEDNRAVLLYPVSDYENGMFLEIGTKVKVLDIFLNPHMPSGYGVLIHMKNSGRDYFVDKDMVMPYKDFNNLYKKAIQMFVSTSTGSDF